MPQGRILGSLLFLFTLAIKQQLRDFVKCPSLIRYYAVLVQILKIMKNN